MSWRPADDWGKQLDTGLYRIRYSGDKVNGPALSVLQLHGGCGESGSVLQL